MSELPDLIKQAHLNVASASSALVTASGELAQASDALAAAYALAAQPPPPAEGGRTVPRVWVGNYAADAFDYTRAQRFDTFIAHWYDSWATQGQRYLAANPGGLCLVYTDVGIASSSGALSAEQARAAGWLAKHNGAEVPNPWGGSGYVVDVGKPGVAEAYVASIKAKWGAQGWGGLFADDANCWANLWRNGATLDGYSSPSDWWARAMYPLLEQLAEVWLVVPNLGEWSGQAALMDQGALACAGGMEEHYLVWENGASLPPSGIEQQYRSLRKVVEAGRTYMGVVHRTDQQGLLYAWAMAALMGGAEHGLVRVGNQMAYGSVAPSYRPELDMVLGEPGPLQHTTGSTVWQRTYSGGYTLRADTAAQVATLS